jgi:hypothetical protein
MMQQPGMMQPSTGNQQQMLQQIDADLSMHNNQSGGGYFNMNSGKNMNTAYSNTPNTYNTYNTSNKSNTSNKILSNLLDSKKKKNNFK